MWATAAPQSTMIHSPLSSPSMRGLTNPASFTLSRTLAASALVWRLDVPDATMTRSNSGDRCSVLKTWMSCALTSSRPSTMARWSLATSFLAADSEVLVVVIRQWFRGDRVNITCNAAGHQRNAPQVLRMRAARIFGCFWPSGQMGQALQAIEIIVDQRQSQSRRTRKRRVSSASGLPSGASRRYSQLASGGMESKIDSVRPPDCRPKCVPRSHTRLNST